MHLLTDDLLNLVDANKDVDGLSAINLGRLFQGSQKAIAPATPLGIMKLIDSYKVDVKGKHCVVIGATPVVGLPLVAMLLNAGATVTVCHEKTVNIPELSKIADVLISATGVPKLIKSEWVKDEAVVIDVGIAKDPITKKLCGDVDFENVFPKCSFITPVPGGVGPMTIACLLTNVVDTWKVVNKIN